MPSPAATTGWGLAALLGATLPVAASIGVEIGQTVPAPAAPPAYTIVWNLPLDGSGTFDVTFAGTLLIVSGSDRPVEARAVETGAVVWSQNILATHPPVVSDDRILLSSVDRIAALETATGRPLWTADVGERHSAPVLHSAGLLVAAGSELQLRRLTDGGLERKVQLAAEPAAGLAVTGHAVFVAMADKSLTRIDLPALTPGWTVKVDSQSTSVAAAHSRVYVAAGIGGLDVFRQDNGRYQWTASDRVPVIGTAAVDDKHVYLALLDNSIRTLGAEDGSQRWRERVEGRPGTGPLFVGPNLCVGLTNGQVTCLPRTSGRPAISAPPPPLPGGSKPVNPRLLAVAVSDAGLIARAMSEFTSTLWLTLAKPPGK